MFAINIRLTSPNKEVDSLLCLMMTNYSEFSSVIQNHTMYTLLVSAIKLNLRNNPEFTNDSHKLERIYGNFNALLFVTRQRVIQAGLPFTRPEIEKEQISFDDLAAILTERRVEIPEFVTAAVKLFGHDIVSQSVEACRWSSRSFSAETYFQMLLSAIVTMGEYHFNIKNAIIIPSEKEWQDWVKDCIDYDDF